MVEPVRIGIVGCGNIVKAHLHAFKTLRDKGFDSFRVTALCDSRIEYAQMFRKRGEGPQQRPPLGLPWDESPIYASDLQDDVLPEVHADWRHVAEASDVDAVLILAPIFLHHQIAMACLRAGKHVLSEKPLAITIRAAGQMIDEARTAGLTLGVAENLRYMEPFRVKRFALDTGRIGALQMWFSVSMSPEDPWTGATDAVRDGTPWRHRRLDAGGGYTLDGGVHRFHQIRYLCGEIEEVSAMTYQKGPRRYLRGGAGQVLQTVESDVDDAFFAHLKFANGAVGSVADGLAARGAAVVLEGGAAIYGTDGCLKGDTIFLDDGSSITAREVYDDEAPGELNDRWFPRGITDAYALEQLDFLRSIQNGTPMETDAEEGLRDLACCFALLESAHANEPVKVADVLSGKVDAYQQPINDHYGL